jgi:tRNA pseudouridine13 synthase
MSQEYVVKQVPEDFLVRENLVVPLVERAEATQEYLFLRKRGYTTMEAVRLLAAELDLPSSSVTYGGLKDEDGVTEQLVAVPTGSVPAGHATGPWRLRSDGERWIELHPYGYGREPLRIGRLEGNGFRIVVRGLAPAVAEHLTGLRKIGLFFLNYYDTQRFGVPGGPKRTHIVGSSMLAKEWDHALQTLIELDAPESPLAASWRGVPEEFFRGLDPRTASFYLAAHSSSAWNAELGRLVAKLGPDRSREVTVDGIGFRYTADADGVVEVLSERRDLPYERYSFDGGVPIAATSRRPTVVQSTVSVGRCEPDGTTPGRASVSLGFFLPSGCYATAAIRQLFAWLPSR